MVGIRGVRKYTQYNFILPSRLLICSTEEGHHFDKWELYMVAERRGGSNRHMWGWDNDVGWEIE